MSRAIDWAAVKYGLISKRGGNVSILHMNDATLERQAEAGSIIIQRRGTSMTW